MPPPSRLREIRQLVATDGRGFRKVIGDEKLVETFGELQQGGKLTRPPKGFDRNLPEIEYIKLKSFIVRKESALSAKKSMILTSGDLKAELMTGFRHAYPLIAWLRQAR